MLYPSPEYIEAGKFKLSKAVREEMQMLKLSYEKLYSQVKESEGDNLIKVS